MDGMKFMMSPRELPGLRAGSISDLVNKKLLLTHK